jgi:hypothetical protein
MTSPEVPDFTKECPHCHTYVMPKDSGQCPACLRDTNDLSGTDPHVTSLTISESQKLPPVCFRCGRAAQSTHRVVARRRNPYVASRAWEVLIIGWLFALPLWLYRRFLGPYGDRLELRLPICDECGAREKKHAIKPIHIDFDNYEMTFLVHKDFRAAVTPNDKRTA